MTRANNNEYCVLLLPATRRDAEVTGAMLARADLAYRLCQNGADLAEQLQQGGGVILLTDAVFNDPDIEAILRVIQQQPPWSDIPSVLLCRPGAKSKIATDVLRSMRNVTVLDRPTALRTLITSLRAAIRARERQYRMRAQFITLQESEAALKHASDALQDASRRKDEFLAMLAHELRNPLAPIRNASEALSRKIHDPQSQKLLSLVKRQVGQLSRLVDDLLDVSRITEGRIELRRTAAEISAILAQARESVEPLIRERNHTLMVEASQERLFVEGDHARLVQSVANLLTNAAKYTDPGGEIRLSVRPQGGEVAIAVSDNGVGISPDLLPRLFNLFVQGERSLARSQGGLGIGLSVVKRLVEMHGGRISATSLGLNRGSTFEIYLPLIDPPRATAAPGTSIDIPPKHILVVDDNADAADSLADLLKLDGHSTEVVYTARDAIARATSTRPQVILLDIGLPDMDGYEVAARLRPILQSTQLIALTGYGQADDIRQASAAGFDAHVIKPVDFATLARILSAFEARDIRPS
jgi:signal transduction histidine kinase/ActR/RegA family two-component response regulator